MNGRKEGGRQGSVGGGAVKLQAMIAERVQSDPRLAREIAQVQRTYDDVRRLVAERKDACISQEEIAEALAVSQPHVSDMERRLMFHDAAARRRYTRALRHLIRTRRPEDQGRGKRTETVNVRVTPEERAILVGCAGGPGKLGSYIRTTCLKYGQKPGR